jgi:hypothetical protein
VPIKGSYVEVEKKAGDSFFVVLGGRRARRRDIYAPEKKQTSFHKSKDAQYLNFP